MPQHRKKAIRNKHQRNNTNNSKEKPVVIASNGDAYNNKWENLEDSDDEEPNRETKEDLLSDSQSEWSDWMSGSGGGVDAEDEVGKNNVDPEIFNKIERLVRIRFETERTFKVA